MADDLDDVDALLEAPYANQDKRATSKENGDEDRKRSSRSPSGDKRRDRSEKKKSKRRSRSRERGGRGSSRDKGRRSRSRSRDRSRRKRSRSRDRRRRSRSRDRERRRRSRSRDRGGRRGSPGGGGGRGRRGGAPRSRTRTPEPLLTPEERDARAVCVMQLSQRVRARDIEDFFSAVGKIRDVRLIVCNKTRRFKGICYVEFRDLESVPLALGLNGQKLLGVPLIVQPSQAEKNRMGNYQAPEPPRQQNKGPMRLYVGSLHFNITEDMLRGIFEPFGTIQAIQLMMDAETGRSKGYGFITYTEAEDAKKALEQLNGFELAGRPMKVGNVTERTDAPIGPAHIDADELDRSGVDLGPTGRLALMAKLAEGTGMKLPQAANQALSTAAANATVARQQHREQELARKNVAQNAPHQAALPPMSELAPPAAGQAAANPPITTQCFMLSNMFDPATEAATNPGWDAEVREDVIEECNKYGGVLHLLVDTVSPSGNVYVKCPNITTAVSAVNALHGRWFAGKVITAAYVPLVNYHNLFPDSIAAATPLASAR